MSFTPEQNDVDISRLFLWNQKFEITDKNGEIKSVVYIRLVGDAELNQARIKAIRASRELREKLRTKNSDERMAFIPDADYATKEELVGLILLIKTRELTQQAIKEVNIPFPKEPSSDASLEKQEKYQKEVDGYEDKRAIAINKLVLQKIEKERLLLEGMGEESLLKEYERLIISTLCEDEMIKTFNDWCVYFGTFKDESLKIRYFQNIEQLQNLPSEIKSQFVDKYSSIELSIDTLKKSLEVMQ